MRVDDSGFVCVRDFLRSGRAEPTVTLRAPNRADALDDDVARVPQTVRLVRHVASSGTVRVLMTNLFDTARFPASCFGKPYRRRWNIKEAFKRLKRRLNLGHVSGLSQQPVAQDVGAKIACDNLQALTTLKPLLPALLLSKKVATLPRNPLQLVAQRTYQHREYVAKPRKPGPKHRKLMTQKHCQPKGEGLTSVDCL